MKAINVIEHIGAYLFDIAPRKKPSLFKYRPYLCNGDLHIYERPAYAPKIVAAFDKCVVTLNAMTFKNVINIYPDYTATYIRHRIKLTTGNFPGLLPGSKIMQCILVPYMRRPTPERYVKSLRLIVITNKGQIYHNYPARKQNCDGEAKQGDIRRFEESAVWDLPDRKFPSPVEGCDSCEKYFPGLKEECYQYHPLLNTSSAFVDMYGNGGFGKSTIVTYRGKRMEAPRFYYPNRDQAAANPFHHIGGAETDYKMTVLGTYRSNTTVGCRICVFASSDGGRNWYCKYEFADAGEYTFSQGSDEWGRNFGNPIKIDSIDSEYIPNSIAFQKRQLVIPSEKNKEPIEKFIYSNIIPIRTVTKTSPFVLSTSEPHGLKTGNVVLLRHLLDCGHEWDWLCNDSANEVSGGTGVFYKVEVVNNMEFKLYECVSSAFTNLPCRHIHHINRIKDGWLIGTGEIYPNGWLLYMQMKEADTFTPKSAGDEFSFIRLNSTEHSVQRTMGAMMLDDEASTIIYASDHDLLERPECVMPDGRKEHFSRSSTGIYRIALTDIDNYHNAKIICEAGEPSYYFKHIKCGWIFCGQRGELIYSNNMRDWWRIRSPQTIMMAYGATSQYDVLGDYLFVINDISRKVR